MEMFMLTLKKINTMCEGTQYSLILKLGFGHIGVCLSKSRSTDSSINAGGPKENSRYLIYRMRCEGYG